MKEEGEKRMEILGVKVVYLVGLIGLVVVARFLEVLPRHLMVLRIFGTLLVLLLMYVFVRLTLDQCILLKGKPEVYRTAVWAAFGGIAVAWFCHRVIPFLRWRHGQRPANLV
jgi:hypothetical protein